LALIVRVTSRLPLATLSQSSTAARTPRIPKTQRVEGFREPAIGT
jgi:hypothetical protein